MATAVTAPSCPYQGSLSSSSFSAMSLLPLLLAFGLFLGLGQAVQRGAYLETNQLRTDGLALGRGGHFGAAVHDFDRLLQHRVRAEVADEIREADERGGPSFDGEERALLLHVGEPQHLGQAAADVIEQLYRHRLALAQTFDEGDALLDVGFAVLEGLHFGENGIEARGLAGERRDLGVERARRARQRPVPEADAGHRGSRHQAAHRHDLLACVEASGALGFLPLATEKVDSNHLSPTCLRARPTATAAVAETSAASVPPSFLASHATTLNGSKCSTGACRRSWRRSRSPSMRDTPPLNTTRSM